jgi:hypothetical protein
MKDPDNPLRDRIDSLPKEIPPARDLWPDIQARLDSEVEPALRAGSTRAERGFHRRLRWPLAIAAALALAATLQWFRPWASGASWAVFPLEGQPQLNRSAFTGRAWLREGGWLETDASSIARLDVGTIGEVRLEPNSRLRLVRATTTDHRIELAQGKMSALIWAPPRLFFVQTPAATAIDLGCSYTLEVDDKGAGTLEVTAGYVALEHGGLESIIPAGLMCLTRPGIGPGTPFHAEASADFRAALDRFDTGDDGAAAQVAELAGENDGVTLWHLLARVTDGARPRIFDTLARLHPPPSGVTRSGILARDADMRDRWGGELGLAAGLRTPGN